VTPFVPSSSLPPAPAVARWASGALDLVAAFGPLASLGVSFCAMKPDTGVLIWAVVIGLWMLGLFVLVGVTQLVSCVSRKQSLGMRAWRIASADGTLVALESPPAWMAFVAMVLFIGFMAGLSDGAQSFGTTLEILGPAMAVAALANWAPLLFGGRTLFERLFRIDTRVDGTRPELAGSPPPPVLRRAFAGLLDGSLFLGPLVPPILVFVPSLPRLHPYSELAVAFGVVCSACVAFTNVRCFADSGHSVGFAVMSLRAVSAGAELRRAGAMRCAIAVIGVAATAFVLAFGLDGPDLQARLLCAAVAAPFVLNALSALGDGRTWLDSFVGVRVVHVVPGAATPGEGPYRSTTASP
jgi:hypothetical protein